jgi:hypothetical protein
LIPVRGTFSFWAEVDGVPQGDPLLEEIYDVAFALSTNGPDIPGSCPLTIPFGNRYLPGYVIDLPSGAGYITYAAVTAPDGEHLIAMLSLIWF